MAAMSDPTDLGAIEALDAIRAGHLSATELIEASLARIAATDGEVLAWTTVDADGARAAARALDDDLRGGVPARPLHGIPIGIKDLIDVAGLPTTAGAAPFAHSRPTRDATLVARLRGAGAVIVGKTVPTQFAFKDPAPTRNPWALDHTPGGSSSGSAAAVAARHVPVAIGTQTVGSILRPSAFCGVVGLKGDYGDVPLDGVLPLARSLDHGGPIARSVADAALVESVLVDRPLNVPQLEAPRLVVPPDLLDLADPGPRAQIELLVERIGDAGAVVIRESLPADLATVFDAGWTVLQAEAAAQHRTWFATHGDEYAPQIAGLIRAGLTRTPAEVEDAHRARAAFGQAVGAWLSTFDALLSPVAPGPAPRRGEGTGDPTLCAPWSYAGLPAIAIPAGLDAAGLPLSIQLVAGPGALERLLGVAAWCECVVGFASRLDLRPAE
jgi:Asp-tRNA(Asn)/Glu-tRNA(Gln) amidotransferase A subunit family amidase